MSCVACADTWPPLRAANARPFGSVRGFILSSHAIRLAAACSALDLFSFSFSFPMSALITVSSDYATLLRRAKRFERFSA